MRRCDSCRSQRTVHKGTVTKSWPRSWPKAAWWLRGGLRYRTQCSDAPVKLPLHVLHEFITTLGPLPPQTAMHTYVNRLREHGWNVWRTVQKALKCGAHLDAEVSGVLRLPVRLRHPTPHPTQNCPAQLYYRPA